MGLRVKAKTMGFRKGCRVRPGDEFVLEDGAAVPKWVDVLGDTAPVKRGRKPAESATEQPQEPESAI